MNIEKSSNTLVDATMDSMNYKKSPITLVDVTIDFRNNEKLAKHSCGCNDRLYK
jgi:hypothetical protein